MRIKPPLKLARSPLVLVLAQVRFSPVLRIGDYVPDIQEDLRKHGFPRFSKSTTQEIVFGSEIMPTTSHRWAFANKEQTQAVVLTDSFVAFEANTYDTFEVFTQTLEAILKVVQDRVNIALAERLGLRYVDLIRPTRQSAAATFLREYIRGFPSSDLGIASAQQFFVMRGKTSFGQVQIKVHQSQDSTILPPDLQSPELAFTVVPEPNERTAILDIDHYTTDSSLDFVPDLLIAEFWKLHGFIDEAFRAATTENAIAHWQTAG
ncbi:MAG: TIGR04255 family protein [Phycisphaerales bacterium]|nr:TIGR04255 family protein [Phycisphaerales bacterium]